MSKAIRSFLSFLLVLQLIIPYSTFAAAVGEFTSVIGNVKQTRAKKVIRPIVKSPIQLKDLIVTEGASSATMVFSDDSKITLSENTKLEIKEFLFKDKSRRGIFSLAIGKLTADVRKYIGGGNIFEVNSPTVAVGVRGTGFEFVEDMKDGNGDPNVGNQRMATVTCTDGSLTLSSLSATGEVISTAVLEAGQVAVIIGGIITISKIGAAVAAALAARSTDTGAAGAAGGAGTGTGGTAAATGMSTGAIVGITAAAIAGTVGIAAVAASGSSSSGSGSGSGGTSTASCNAQQVAGGDTADSRNVELGKKSGTFNFTYNTYSIQDRIVLRCETGGSTLYDTGCVGASATQAVPFSCSTTKITVSVTPNCANPGGTGTAWDYTVSCP